MYQINTDGTDTDEVSKCVNCSLCERRDQSVIVLRLLSSKGDR